MTTCLKLVFVWSSVWNFPNTRANASISNKLCQGLNTVNSFLIKSCVYWVQWWVFDKDAKHAAPCIWFLAMHLMPEPQIETMGSWWQRAPPQPESSHQTALGGKQSSNSNHQSSERDQERLYRDFEQNFRLYDCEPVVHSTQGSR